VWEWDQREEGRRVGSVGYTRNTENHSISTKYKKQKFDQVSKQMIFNYLFFFNSVKKVFKTRSNGQTML